MSVVSVVCLGELEVADERDVRGSVEVDPVPARRVLPDLAFLQSVGDLLRSGVERRVLERLSAKLGLEESLHDLQRAKARSSSPIDATTRTPRQTHLVADPFSDRPEMLHPLLILVVELPSFEVLWNLVREHGKEDGMLSRGGIVGRERAGVAEVPER
jgi:hypothetical protein